MLSSAVCRHGRQLGTCIQCGLEAPNSQANSGQITIGGGLIEQTILPIAESKAAKNDQEKPDLSLIPYIGHVAEAQAFMVGEKKYGRYNYCKGHKVSQLVAAIMRHANAYNQGEENDPVDGQPHLGSIKACCSMLLRQAELGTLIDDRYKNEHK